MKHFFLIGTHGSGKTSLLKLLQIDFPHFPVYPEAAVLLNQTKKNPIIFDPIIEKKRDQNYQATQKATIFSQLEIFELTYKQSLSKAPIAFFDRSVIDVYIYTKHFIKHNLIQNNTYTLLHMETVVKNFIKSNPILLFVEPFTFESDYQKEIHQETLHFLKENNTPYLTIPSAFEIGEKYAFFKTIINTCLNSYTPQVISKLKN